MGKALSALFSNEKKSSIDIFLDFEKAVPTTDNEKKVHAEVAEYMQESEKILGEISKFKGCDEAIRKAITSPGPETEKAAWDAIVPSVDTLKHFFDFSTHLDQKVCKPSAGSVPNFPLTGPSSSLVGSVRWGPCRSESFWPTSPCQTACRYP